MQFNTRLSNLLIRTRTVFRNGFRETRHIHHWFKKTHVPAKHRADYQKHSSYRQDCPAAILHFRDIYSHLSYKQEGLFKSAFRLLALLLSAFIELPVLLVKSLIIDVITFSLTLVKGFIIDTAELALNIISDILSLPAAIFNVLANKAPTFKKVENTNQERGEAPVPVPGQQANSVLGQKNISELSNDKQQASEQNLGPHKACSVPRNR